VDGEEQAAATSVPGKEPLVTVDRGLCEPNSPCKKYGKIKVFTYVRHKNLILICF